MIIAVVSPHTENNGNTVTSAFLSLGLASHNKKVLLTHTASQSKSFYRYLGLENYEDKTTTPRQLVKLLKEEAIQPDAIPDYCKPVFDNLEVFTNNQETFTDEDMFSFSDFILQLSIYDFIVYDVNSLDTKTAKLIMRKADLILYNVTQSIIGLDKAKEHLLEKNKFYKQKKMMLVCNKFDKIAGKEKSIVNHLGVKKNSTGRVRSKTISYNPWVINACNDGVLIDLYKQAKQGKAMLIEFDKDIDRLAKMVSKANVALKKERRKAKKNKIGGR